MSNRKSILLELIIDGDITATRVLQFAEQLNIVGFDIDEHYTPIKMSNELDRQTFILHGWVIDQDVEKKLRAHPTVINIWMDTEFDHHNNH